MGKSGFRWDVPILTKTSNCGNTLAKVRPAYSAVVLSQLTFMWPSYVMPLSQDTFHSTKSNFLQVC